MSLLDDVSIVVTPNGYKAGELYAVIPVPTEGAEEITDGSNANAGANWNANANWDKTVAGLFSCDGTTSNDINQDPPSAVIGKQYILSFEVLSINVGGKLVMNFGGAIGTDRTAVGVYSETITATGTDRVRVRPNTAGTIGSVTGISVKEYTAADMDVTRATAATRVDEDGLVNYAEVLGSEEIDLTTGSTTKPTDWGSITTGGASYLATTGTTSYYDTGFTVTSGVPYKLSFTLSDYTGTSTMGFSTTGGVSSNARLSADGSHTEYFIASSSVELRLFGLSSNTGVFSNISVKEADRDNVPRIDYTGGGCPHILSEPQRTNEVTYSEDFSNAYFQKIRSTISTDQIVSPDGTQNADKFIEDSALGTKLLWTQDEVISFGDKITWSVFAKKGEREWIMLRDAQAGSFTVFFDLENGVIGTSSGVDSSKIEDYGSGWYRCSITYTSTTTTARGRLYLADANSGESYQGNGTSGLYIWGAQLEAGSYATSYIPNFGTVAGVTRNQDIFTRDGIGSLIGQTEGTFFIELSKPVLNPDSYYLISLNNAAANNDDNSLSIGFVTSNNKMFIRLQSNNSDVFSSTDQNSNANTFYKIGIAYKSGASLIYIDGSPITPNSGSLSGTFTFSATLDNLSFDFDGNNTFPFYGKVKQLQVYDTALTDEQLLQLTGESGTDFYESYAAMASALTYTIQ